MTRRTKVDGNLSVARATSARVAVALAERRPAPAGHDRTTPKAMIAGYLDAIANIRNLAPWTRDRYRSALDRSLGFCDDDAIGSIDAFDERTVEEFVRWLRGQTRTRNGAAEGKRAAYKTGGIRFILSTCRAAFNWASRRRMLSPHAANPFKSFPIDKLRDRDEGSGRAHVLTPAQEKSFFDACDDWQRGIFVVLAAYGLRVGELTHLLVEDVDFEAGAIEVRSKPDLRWSVKTGRARTLPLVPVTRDLLRGLIGDRRSGFVFLNEEFATGRAKPSRSFSSPGAFSAHIRSVAADLVAARGDASEEDTRRAVTAFCRTMGQIPDKRIRGEFMKVTTAVGCPEFTRAHDLRHLFSTRAQEAGVNPLFVQELLGHTTLEMIRRYTHLGLDAKREALEKLGGGGRD